MNNANIDEVENVIELNFLDELSQHKYFKWLFEIEVVRKICEMPFVKKIFDHHITKKFMNREMIMYLIFGVLATVVNIGALALFLYGFKIDYRVANILAIIASILFAYYTNKKWVFRSKTDNLKALAQEFVKFISARAVTAVLEAVGVPLFVEYLFTPVMLAKILFTIIVIIVNYFFSKKTIFVTKS